MQGTACLCAGVSFAELDEAIAIDRDSTVESLGTALGCGIQCGSCIPAIREALGQVAWFAATAVATPITRTSSVEGLERLIFRVDISLGEDGPYPAAIPGQHVVVRARTDDGLVERTYTVVSQDVPARKLTVAIRRTPGGKLTPWLLQTGKGVELRRIEVSVPGGPGLASGGNTTDVFLAGGVGVTPAISMMNALPPLGRMHVVYSVAEMDDAAFVPQFEARLKDRPNFRYSIRDSSTSGPISDRQIRPLVAKYPDAKYCICGPQGYVDVVLKALKRAGVQPSRIHVELFALAGTRTLAQASRSRGYFAGAVLAALPLFLLVPTAEDLRPHGHPNVGHEQLKCVSCHVESSASTRQALQAKAKFALGLRQSGAVAGMQPVTSSTCIQCHANPDDRHAPNRFLEPRFDKARADVGPQLCVSCHREHSGVRVTAPKASYCVSCHQDMQVKNDKVSPTHKQLVVQKRWETCMQCHDYHGNHRWNAPLRLQDANALDVLNKYLKDGPSPYGATVVKARQEKPS